MGHGNPIFAVDIKDTIPVKKLMDSTSLALGSLYEGQAGGGGESV